MNEVLEFIKNLFQFTLWTGSLPYFATSASEDQAKEFNRRFEGGFQKTVLLTVLIYSCNFTFWRGPNSGNPKALLPIAVSGFAVYILTYWSIALMTGQSPTQDGNKELNRAKYYSNILILHLVLTLSLMLIGNLIRFSEFLDDKIFSKIVGIDFINIVSISLFYSSLITLTMWLNTRKQDSDSEISLRSKPFYTTIYVAAVLSMFMAGRLFGN
jgi:hypothetical protein